MPLRWRDTVSYKVEEREYDPLKFFIFFSFMCSKFLKGQHGVTNRHLHPYLMTVSILSGFLTNSNLSRVRDVYYI